MTERHLAAVNERPNRVVLYVRVSSLMGRGGDDFHSPEVQVGAMRRVTAGMQVVEIVDDDIDRTGRDFDREGIDRIRRLVETGVVDTMAVYNISRFGRNTLEGLQFLAWLADRDVTILSATEHVDTSTPSGRWMLTNLLAMAEMRSDEIGAEWSRTIAARARAGKPHGRISAGYLRNERGTLEPDPATSRAVTEAFESYAAGAPVIRIRQALRTATGSVFHTSTLKSLLTNRVYLGRVQLKGAHGTVEVPDSHQPLVDAETWSRVQARIARDRKMPARLAQPQHPLSGLGRCGVCKGATNHRRAMKGGRPEIYCRRQQQDAACTGCGMPRAEGVEAVVLDRISRKVAELRGDVGAQATHAARATRARGDARAVEEELRATRRAMARATERWAREQIDDQVYEDTMGSMREDESRLALALESLRSEASLPEPGKLVLLGERLLKLWPRLNGTQRNRALRELVRTVTIMPSQRWRQPVDERVTIQWL